MVVAEELRVVHFREPAGPERVVDTVTVLDEQVDVDEGPGAIRIPVGDLGSFRSSSGPSTISRMRPSSGIAAIIDARASCSSAARRFGTGSPRSRSRRASSGPSLFARMPSRSARASRSSTAVQSVPFPLVMDER